MRLLVLGATGMLGHKLSERLSGAHDVTATLRDARSAPALRARLPRVEIFSGITAEEPQGIAALLRDKRPDAVINCVGIIKQLHAAKDPVHAIAVNALFPHRLAAMCAEVGARLVHFSTDCVFSGERGPYRPDDLPDARDLYGRTKSLGEVAGPRCLTLRSSIIGHELKGHLSLVDWFVSQRGRRVRGFAHALYTGLPTVVMADLVARALLEWPDLEGVWQVAADPISKYELLGLINEAYGLGICLERDEAFACDRRLDGSAFRARTGWAAPPWPDMVRTMHTDFAAHGGSYGL